MAGRRRTTGARMPDGSVRPTAAAGRPQRIQQKMQARYAVAQTELQRLAAACDYLRSAAVWTRKTEPGRTDEAVAALVRQLIRTGDDLLKIPAGGRTGVR